MKVDSDILRIAIALVLKNLGLGMMAILLLLSALPAIGLNHTMDIWIWVAMVFAGGIFLAPDFQPVQGAFGLVRVISCLLLGCSFIAIFWKWNGFPHAFGIIVTSFSLRWLLFFMESLRIRESDARREPLPSYATRVRRWITFVTGAVIPVLIFCGFSPVPWLVLSFLLTLFAQWAVACEVFHHRKVGI